jgi:hypothetical protein
VQGVEHSMREEEMQAAAVPTEGWRRLTHTHTHTQINTHACAAQGTELFCISGHVNRPVTHTHTHTHTHVHTWKERYKGQHCLSGPHIYIWLARTVYIHRIWPYIWWFPCQKYCIYTVYIWFWLTLHISHALTTTLSLVRVETVSSAEAGTGTQSYKVCVCACVCACVCVCVTSLANPMLHPYEFGQLHLCLCFCCALNTSVSMFL